MQLELAPAQPAAPRDGQLLDRAQSQRPGALDQVLLIKRTQLPLGLPGGAAHSLRSALRAPQRSPSERERAQQVVPVAVRRKQPAR